MRLRIVVQVLLPEDFLELITHLYAKPSTIQESWFCTTNESMGKRRRARVLFPGFKRGVKNRGAVREKNPGDKRQRSHGIVDTGDNSLCQEQGKNRNIER